MAQTLPFPEYDHLDGLGLAECIRRGEVSMAEVTEAALARVALRNPALNAIVRPLDIVARAMVHEVPPAGPFAGVPMAVKDLLSTIAGVPTSNGTRVLQQVIPDHDSELIARYRRAGAVFIGKSNTPEFGLTPFTESVALGPARNPWDVSRTPGGSSGGSGAAVAARIVPIAHGGDGGGSIRIPASCNGVFGLKPSRGRMPTGPDLGDSWRGFVQEHVLTRSVRDSAAMLDLTAGEDAGAPLSCPPQVRPYLDEVTREPGALRIAITSLPFFGHDARDEAVHPDCRAALHDAAGLLQALGHQVETAAPLLDGPRLARAFLTVVAAECHADLRWLGEQLRRAPRTDDVEVATWALHLVGGSYSAGDYASSVRLLQEAGRVVGAFFTTYDLLVTPTLATPPFPIGQLQPSASERAALALFGKLRMGGVLRAAGLLDETARKVFGFMPYTPLFNVTGQPAMSVPLYWNAQGLPIGTQVVARLGDEAMLFRLAAQLEQARPWGNRRPAELAGM
jgi:amidase